MGMLGSFSCPDCGYRNESVSEIIEMGKAHSETHEAKQSSFRDTLNFPCPQCGSTTKSENDLAKVKLAGWIVLGIVITALVYYLDLLELIGL